MIIIVLLSGCVSMPKITPQGEVSPETDWVPFWKARKRAEDMMATKGWEKPEQNTEDESDVWLWLAGLAGLCAIGCFVGGYLSHWHELIGAGVILGVCAVIATGISAIIGWIAWVAGGLLVAALAWLGVRLRKWSFSKNG
jgi:hypothetical protein